MPEFDVLGHENGHELLPDFFTGELSRKEQKLYRKLRDMCEVQDGALVVQGGNFERGQRVSLREVADELLDQKSTLYDKLMNQCR